MKVLLVHPSPLMYSEVYLRLEPLGLELVAESLRQAGHHVRILDLQIFRHADYFRELNAFDPEAVGFSLNYMPNVPEVINLAKKTRNIAPACFQFVGGHTASFIPEELLSHSLGAIDCIVKGDGEITARRLLETLAGGGIDAIGTIPGVTTINESGGPAELVNAADLDDFLPARDLTRRRQRYFIGEMDPCASIEFSRGCPWSCSFCSAWTFYNRSYRLAAPERIAEDLSRIAEPNVYVVDDIAFVQPDHAYAIGEQIEKRGIRKRYLVETRCDILIRNEEVFAYWKKLGLSRLFLGFEAIDKDGLKQFRKKISLHDNFRALEIARKLGISVALNIIVHPDWDENRFRIIEDWAASVPEIVHLSVLTPYPGTQGWPSAYRKLKSFDYRLFDIQHAVLPTRLPLKAFYRELVRAQSVLNRKHLRLANMGKAAMKTLKCLAHGQTNFAKALWKFNSVYNPERQYSDHFTKTNYELQPPVIGTVTDAKQLYIHRLRSHSEKKESIGLSGFP